MRIWRKKENNASYAENEKQGLGSRVAVKDELREDAEKLVTAGLIYVDVYSCGSMMGLCLVHNDVKKVWLLPFTTWLSSRQGICAAQ